MEQTTQEISIEYDTAEQTMIKLLQEQVEWQKDIHKELRRVATRLEEMNH